MTAESARKRTSPAVPFAALLGYVAAAAWAGPAQAQNWVMERAVRECKAGCLETVRDVKDPGAACAYACWCMYTDKLSKTAEESQQKCVDEYKARDDESLSGQEIEPVHLVYFEHIRSHADEIRVRRHFSGEPRLRGAKLLACTYGSSAVRFWYDKVPITRKELLAVYERHPMRTLGDVALTSCPKTLTEAKKFAR